MNGDADTHDTVRWEVVWRDACETLAAAGIEAADIEARRLVEAAAGVEPRHFHDVLRQPATLRAVARLDSMLSRRRSGEPLQYVVGSWGFRNLDLMIDPRVLIPRPETEVVAGRAISEVRRLKRARTGGDGSRPAQRAGDAGSGEPNGSAGMCGAHPPRAGSRRPVNVVDLGTGSGAIALSVAAECPDARVFATDVSLEALAVVRANLAGLGRAAARVTLHEGDWFEALPADLRGRVEVIVSNTPYVGAGEHLPAEVSQWEPELALRAGDAGCEHIAAIISESPQWLRSGGALVVEMAPHHTAAMCRLAGKAGLSVSVVCDLAGHQRALTGRLP